MEESIYERLNPIYLLAINSVIYLQENIVDPIIAKFTKENEVISNTYDIREWINVCDITSSESYQIKTMKENYDQMNVDMDEKIANTLWDSLTIFEKKIKTFITLVEKRCKILALKLATCQVELEDKRNELYETTIILAESELRNIVTQRKAKKQDKHQTDKINFNNIINLQLTMNEILSIIDIKKPCDDELLVRVQKEMQNGKLTLEEAVNFYPIDDSYLFQVVQRVKEFARLKERNTEISAIELIENQIQELSAEFEILYKQQLKIGEQLKHYQLLNKTLENDNKKQAREIKKYKRRLTIEKSKLFGPFKTLI